MSLSPTVLDDLAAAYEKISALSLSQRTSETKAAEYEQHQAEIAQLKAELTDALDDFAELRAGLRTAHAFIENERDMFNRSVARRDEKRHAQDRVFRAEYAAVLNDIQTLLGEV
jgi:Mg2+ and Co2+ transporter CorA